MYLSSLLLFVVPVALALPTSLVTEGPTEETIEARQCFVTCGSTCYTSAQVSAARSAGYNHYTRGTTVGSNSYPHTYRNLEGFDFLVSGPYQEFPLRTSGVYTGGSPGADRVVFNTAGARAGEITHTGASGNAFVACSGW